MQNLETQSLKLFLATLLLSATLLKALWDTQARPPPLSYVSVSLVTSQSQALRWEYDLALRTDIHSLPFLISSVGSYLLISIESFFPNGWNEEVTSTVHGIVNNEAEKLSNSHFSSSSLCFVPFSFKTSLWECFWTSVIHMDIYHYVYHTHKITFKYYCGHCIVNDSIFRKWQIYNFPVWCLYRSSEPHDYIT